MRLRRVLVLLSIMLCGALAGRTPLAMAQSGAPAATWGLPQLMRDLSEVKSASARFTERKTMHMLSAPLVEAGSLRYVAPDRVEKITISPVPERFVLDRNRVTIAAGAHQPSHIFSLTGDPKIAGLVEGIRATLAGDLPTLERFYVVQFTGTPARWQLILLPKGAALTRFISQLRIRGSADRIETIDTESSNGDHSEMSIVETVVDAR